MPHCILECTKSVAAQVPVDRMMRAVHDAALASELFTVGDVKIRVLVHEHSLVGGINADFVHVFAYVLTGRSEADRKKLSAAIVRGLAALLPAVQAVSCDVREMERATFSNRRNAGIDA
ncbi:5-carboxymethyl-2-hydroxymuconate Delta-isomerase [Rhizobacter sp. P5_C2]|jgi:5-carboxymethyl-2-hydroxymuconate isomerase